MKKPLVLTILLLLITVSACKDIYYPQLDETGNVLVVSGLVTDEPGVYTIKLSYAIAYNGGGTTPVQEAKIHVEDNHGNTYNFDEGLPGVYNSDPTKFITHYGYVYTLIIQTKDRTAYRSSPQTLYPKGSLDSIRTVIKNSTLTTYYGEGAKLTTVRGAEFISDIDLQNDASAYYRFANALLFEYTSQQIISKKDTQDLPSYCWIKYTPYEFLNLSERHSTGNKTQQLLGFCPLDTTFYGIITIPIMVYNQYTGHTEQVGIIKRTPHLCLLTFKQYHLNADVYLYYKAVNDQLAASQQILDPISVQAVGNIVCTTNSDEPVLGVFEVASLRTASYSYNIFDARSGIELQSIPPIDPARYSDGDCVNDAPPIFWVK